MSLSRALRVTATSAVLALAIGTATTTAAEARPAPGPTGLAATVTPHPGGTYDVAATWNPVATATAYRVALTKGGATLSSATVTTTAWSPTVTATPGLASLSVRAVVAKKPGKVSTLSVPLPDATPPTGAFHATWDNNTGIATITITSPVADDSGGPVTASVNWGDTPATIDSWNLASDITHQFALTSARYAPTVTLTDSSNNSAVVDVNAVVINDTEAPTGTFTVSPATAWSKLTRVTVTQTAIHDNWSPDANIARSVDWGDGTAPAAWTTGTTISHVYRVTTGATYTPKVTLTDEALNASAPLDTSAVTVKVDSTGPVVKFLLPKSRHSVKAFRTLKGTATDTGGTGVRSVTVKAIEKRGTVWYGYNATTKTWVKAATKAKAFGKAKAAVVRTNSSHVWAVTLTGLRKGTLVYRAFARDKVANKSTTVTHKATLTHR